MLLLLAWLAGKAQDVDLKINDIKTAMIERNYEAGLKECKNCLNQVSPTPRNCSWFMDTKV